MEALAAVGGAEIITTTLKESAFDIRKEAAYAVANMCAGEHRHAPHSLISFPKCCKLFTLASH